MNYKMISLINKITKNVVLPLAVAGSLVLGGCGDKEKYQNFANFIKKEGTFDKTYEDFNLNFSANNKEYFAHYNSYSYNEKILIIDIYDGKSIEHFQDANLDGLNYYSFDFEGRNLVSGYSFGFFQSKENKGKYEMLIDSIPKWYSETKNK